MSSELTALFSFCPPSPLPSSNPTPFTDLHVLNATAFDAAGLTGTRPVVVNTSELVEGDLFGTIAAPGYG